MNFYLRKVCLLLAWRWGGELRWCKNLFKPKESSSKALFSHYSQVLTRVEGGVRGPNTPAGVLGSPVKTSPNLLAEKSNFNTRAGFTITFAWTVQADVYFNNFRSGAERLNNFKEEKYDDS